MSTTVSSVNLPHMKDISGNILLAFFCQSAVSAEVSNNHLCRALERVP